MVLQIYSVPKIIDMRLQGLGSLFIWLGTRVRFSLNTHTYSQNPGCGQDNSMCVSNKHPGSRESLMTAIVLRSHATF